MRNIGEHLFRENERRTREWHAYEREEREIQAEEQQRRVKAEAGHTLRRMQRVLHLEQLTHERALLDLGAKVALHLLLGGLPLGHVSTAAAAAAYASRAAAAASGRRRPRNAPRHNTHGHDD